MVLAVLEDLWDLFLQLDLLGLLDLLVRLDLLDLDFLADHLDLLVPVVPVVRLDPFLH